MKIATHTQPQARTLTQIAKEGTPEELATALKTQGTAIMDDAVDVFFQMDREQSDARRVLDGFQDMKTALQTSVSGDESTTLANGESLIARVKLVNNGEDSEVSLKPAEIIPLKNAKAKYDSSYTEARSSIPNGIIESGERRLEAETAHAVSPSQLDDMTGVKKFLTDLSQLQGLYAAVAMVPGPMSASLKTIAKEVLHSKSKSYGSTQSAWSATGVGLLPLGVAKGVGSSVEGHTSESNTSYSRTTADERIVPKLFDLKDRLAQADVSPAGIGRIEGRQAGREYVECKGFFSFGTKLKQAGRDVHKRVLSTMPYQEERVRLPLTGVSDFQ